ncbi:MAG: ROK family transcriptional regulator [Actinobacteria bacterium]|nr:MAG: ROK family transcriptional regulator [Actinomycetota bacterium]
MPPRTPGATPPLLRNLNERTVLEAIRAGAPISRAQISRRSGISKPTVSLALQSLLEAGLVREASEPPDGPGYGALYFEPVADAALVLGLDLGARFVRGAVCDLAGTVRARQDVELSVAAVPDAIKAIERLRTSLLGTSGLDPDLVDSVVVGVPGVVERETGVLRLAENVAGLEGREFASELQSALDLPVTLENDINLAALGEQWQGVAQGVEDFVFLSIGTGMGAGLILRGELHRGRHGAAGEIDFALMGVEETLDPSAPQVSVLASELAGRPADARAVFGDARKGDQAAGAVVAEIARRIAAHLAPIAAVADVELVVLGGGIGANGDLLLDPVSRLLADWLPFPPRVEVSTLGEAAVLTGALAIGLQAALENVFARRSVASVQKPLSALT